MECKHNKLQILEGPIHPSGKDYVCNECGQQFRAEELMITSKPEVKGGLADTKIPGLCAKHAIVTPECRKNRTPLGALAEAIERLQLEYVACSQVLENKNVTYHFVLTVERQ